MTENRVGSRRTITLLMGMGVMLWNCASSVLPISIMVSAESVL